METKQIVFTKKNTAELICKNIKDVPGDDEIMVKTIYTAISNGTERANLTGDLNVHGNSAPDPSKPLFPRCLGYSGAGEAVAVGKNVKKVKCGDMVATSWGVHANYQMFKEENVEIVPEGVELREAALTHIATFPLAAIRKMRCEIGENTLVMGIGILGLIAIKFLKASGMASVIAADLDEKRRSESLKMGADYALDPSEKGFSEMVKKLTDGGANAAVEVTGVGAGLDECLDCMAKFGRIALLGCTRDKNFTIDYYKKVHCPGITLIGAHTMARPQSESHPGWWTTSDDKKAILKLLLKKRITFGDLINEVREPGEAGAVYKRLAFDKAFPTGVLFKWTDEI